MTGVRFLAVVNHGGVQRLSMPFQADFGSLAPRLMWIPHVEPVLGQLTQVVCGDPTEAPGGEDGECEQELGEEDSAEREATKGG